MTELFAAQLAERMRNLDTPTNPAIRLAARGVPVDVVVRHAQERLGASNVTLRGTINAFHGLSSTDRNDLFKDVSMVEARVRQHPGHAAMDFAARNLYRSGVKELSRGRRGAEIDLAETAVRPLAQAVPDTPASDPGPRPAPDRPRPRGT